MKTSYIWLLAVVVALVTALIRFLPFWIFGGGRKTPPVVEKLGRVLPYAVMGMLVVYCMKGVEFPTLSGFLPALIASLVVVGLHLWKRNTLISIVCGTISYMLMVQLVF
ncbi:MAG: branched-chain amino acid transporter AzlD [Ruminococcaceae bacterium]|nr:branched-chain amino acid transporter AzlD [Oscillospiraceae bacterium]